jgi:hyaluronoglucosaminidase
MILWDNYPVNDYHNTMYVGPLENREAGLSEVLYGMMANPMRDNRMTRLPLYTMADFMNNPYEYDPERSIAEAVDHIAQNDAQAEILTTLIGYYSSNLKYDNRSTKYNHLRSEFERLLAEDKGAAVAFKEGVEAFYGTFCETFPEDYELSKEVISRDIEWMNSTIAE